MVKSLKAVAALLIFVVVYFAVSTLVYVIVIYFNGGSVLSLSGWRAFSLAAFANAWGAVFGVSAGRALLDHFMTPYFTRFVGIAFISLLGIWFIPLTLIYAIGGAGYFMGDDLGDWPPEGEFEQYFVGVTRSIVATICAWFMLIKRNSPNPPPLKSHKE